MEYYRLPPDSSKFTGGVNFLRVVEMDSLVLLFSAVSYSLRSLPLLLTMESQAWFRVQWYSVSIRKHQLLTLLNHPC